jgi:phosphopantothenoylcysteine decarboxylase/phosphopantothenate--cysteine ligase
MYSADFTGELQDRHIVLGLSGGAACFKAAEFCRLLTKSGATVQVVMTEAACQFITPVTMQALSGRPVMVSQWDARVPNNMAHINLTREADAIMVSPASADFIAQLAQGRAHELLALLCLARPMARIPLLLAPSMNREMWAHPATQRNLHQVAHDGAQVLGVGEGRMLEPDELMAELIGCFTPKSLIGQRVVITAGPTFEAIDPVRGLTNLSSGKMGFAIAGAASAVGADVTLIAGPVAQPTPRGVERVDVVSALQMHGAVTGAVGDADIFISAAAVADWRPENPAEQKIKKDGSGRVPQLAFVENPDILAEVAHSPRAQAGDLFCVGFAAETENLRANAQAKRARKGVPLLVANLGPATFGRDDNALLLVDDEGETELPRASKRVLARQLVAEIARRVSGSDA